MELTCCSISAGKRAHRFIEVLGVVSFVHKIQWFTVETNQSQQQCEAARLFLYDAHGYHKRRHGSVQSKSAGGPIPDKGQDCIAELAYRK